MSLVIDASDLFTRRSLVILESGVRFVAGSFAGGRFFRFTDIDWVVLSPAHVLSFQVGLEVISIQTRSTSPKHRAAIAALVTRLERTVLPPASPRTDP